MKRGKIIIWSLLVAAFMFGSACRSEPEPVFSLSINLKPKFIEMTMGSPIEPPKVIGPIGDAGFHTPVVDLVDGERPSFRFEPVGDPVSGQTTIFFGYPDGNYGKSVHFDPYRPSIGLTDAFRRADAFRQWLQVGGFKPIKLDPRPTAELDCARLRGRQWFDSAGAVSQEARTLIRRSFRCGGRIRGATAILFALKRDVTVIELTLEPDPQSRDGPVNGEWHDDGTPVGPNSVPHVNDNKSIDEIGYWMVVTVDSTESNW